ncbi:MAG: LytTR family transcriptional regulator DNA-binding domain-containing protein [Spirochaetes bacterium]|nr:LytTR family transcriptional regulator DNA-binding domain-containing protein [Spirochaetota bacterium]
MNINLQCNNNRKAIAEILESRGFIIDDRAEVTFAEKGTSLPAEGVVLSFDPLNLNEFIEFLDEFPKSGSGKARHVIGRKGDSYEIVQTENIIFFLAEGNITKCYTEDYEYEVKQKLYELENSLQGNGFARVNKSHIINILWVEEIVPWFAGRLLLKFREIENKIEVSRSYVRSFKNFIGM